MQFILFFIPASGLHFVSHYTTFEYQDLFDIMDYLDEWLLLTNLEISCWEEQLKQEIST